MTELITVPLDGGGAVVMQIDEATDPTGVIKARRPGDALVRAAQTLDEALEPIAAAARSTVAKLRAAGPDEIQVEFGLQFTAELGAVITKAGTDANLKITLSWGRGDDAG